MPNSESGFTDLEKRVQVLEDELAIHRLIIEYGFAVDSGEADATANLFTEETTFDVDNRNIMQGREGVRNMVLGIRHQSLLPNAAHCIGPAIVRVDGDKATATGYSRIYHKEEDIQLFRIGYNRWELEKHNGKWLISKRTVRAIGHKEGQGILRGGISNP